MTKDMTTGSPLRMILLFSVPVLLGNIFQQFYNMVDTIIVGQYLGEDALAAVGSTGCLMFLVLGFANGIAQGFGVMVSHAFGAKDFKLLKHYVALSLILTAIVSLLLTIPTVAASRQFLILMKTPDNILGLADSYIKVIFAGILLTMSYNVASGILRGIGDSKTPLYFLILSSFLNIVLDLFLIVVVKLGTAGAAYATIIAQRPKMRPHIDQMRENMAKALKIDVDQINVKATTEEGLGFTGSGEGISSQAICAIEKFTNYSSVDVMEKPAGCGGCCAGK